MAYEQPSSKALLVLPRLRVQNANAVSSPMTWGFPAITAFTGLMTALERRLGRNGGIAFHGVGMVCHGIEPQVTRNRYTRSFHLTRNPVLQDGSTAAIVEEGRTHLDLTLIFDVELVSSLLGETERQHLAAQIGDVIAGMRIAGGSVVPPIPGTLRQAPRPYLVLMPPKDSDACRKQFRRLSRRWLPGFALVSRDDLLQARLVELQQDIPEATLLDALLDLSRLNFRAIRQQKAEGTTANAIDDVAWAADTRPGWIVPIPVGFATLGPLHAPGTVAGARNPALPFAFVESVYSMGQWISPHRLNTADDLLWHTFHDSGSGLYRCVNAFHGAPSQPFQSY